MPGTSTVQHYIIALVYELFHKTTTVEPVVGAPLATLLVLQVFVADVVRGTQVESIGLIP